MNFIETWLALINLLGLLLVGYDKHQAQNRGWRIPEKRFFLLALLGGSPGIYLGMRAFRHKTQHTQFTLGIPLFLLVNLSCLYLLNKYGLISK